jgi:hypothetical protein
MPPHSHDLSETPAHYWVDPDRAALLTQILATHADRCLLSRCMLAQPHRPHAGPWVFFLACVGIHGLHRHGEVSTQVGRGAAEPGWTTCVLGGCPFHCTIFARFSHLSHECHRWRGTPVLEFSSCMHEQVSRMARWEDHVHPGCGAA